MIFRHACRAKALRAPFRSLFSVVCIYYYQIFCNNVDRHLCTAAQTISTAAVIVPPDPEDEYRVEWQEGGGVATLKRRQLIRQKVPLTRAVFKSWLHLNASEEPIAVSPSDSFSTK